MGCSSVDIVVQSAAIKTIKVRFFKVSSIPDSYGNLIKETTCNLQPSSGGSVEKPVGEP